MAYVETGGSRRVRSFLTLVGAQLKIRSPPDETPEALQRSLRCHEALRVMRGAAEGERDRDPLWHPGGRVRIDVRRDRDDYVVELRPDPLALAGPLRDRACAWAGRPAAL